MSGRGVAARASEGLNPAGSRRCEKAGPPLEAPPLSAVMLQQPSEGTAGSDARALEPFRDLLMGIVFHLPSPLRTEESTCVYSAGLSLLISFWGCL